MATGTWTGGANDGVFMTATNWTGLGGAAPANGDTLIIGATSQTIAGAATGLTTVTLKVLAGFSGTAGLDTPLTFSSITLLEYAGTGAGANFGTTTATAANFTHTAGTVTISSGTWTTVNNSLGTLVVPAATVVTTCRNIGGTLTAGYNATAFTTLENSGQATVKRICTTATCMRGSLVQQDNGTTTYTSCGTANVHNGATYNKQSGGTDTTVNLYPGSRFTIAGTSGGSAGTVTVTTLNKYAGSAAVLTVPGLTLTVGTTNYLGAPGASD